MIDELTKAERAALAALGFESRTRSIVIERDDPLSRAAKLLLTQLKEIYGD